MSNQHANMVTTPIRPCPDCAVARGEAHTEGCDVARCLADGRQPLQCWWVRRVSTASPHCARASWKCGECGDDIWTGEWSGTIEPTIHAGRSVLRDQLATVRVGDAIAVRYECEVAGRTGTKCHNDRTVVEPAARSASSIRPLEVEIDNGLLFDEDEAPEVDDAF